MKDTLKRLIENAVENLPEGWIVCLEIERGAAWIHTIRPNGTEVEADSDSNDLNELMRLAIQAAYDEHFKSRSEPTIIPFNKPEK